MLNGSALISFWLWKIVVLEFKNFVCTERLLSLPSRSQGLLMQQCLISEFTAVIFNVSLASLAIFRMFHNALTWLCSCPADCTFVCIHEAVVCELWLNNINSLRKKLNCHFHNLILISMYVFLKVITLFSKYFLPSSVPTWRPCESMWNDSPFGCPKWPLRVSD